MEFNWDCSLSAYDRLYVSLRPHLGSGSFYRAAIPQDITQGLPDPSNWGEPDAALAPQNCNISQYFANHSIIFGMSSGLVHLFQAQFTSRYHVLW